MRRKAIAALVAVAGALLAATGAHATPGADHEAVFRDWQPDHDVTPCRFTRAQLVNAREIASANPDFETYSPGFRDEVGRELARHATGGCRGVAAPSGARLRSRLRSVRIVAIKPKGGARESVTIRNAGRAAVSLKGASLRDRGGRRVRLRGRLAGRQSLTVVSGCAPGRRGPARVGSRLFACRRGTLWDDRGDVVRVFDSRGVVVAQRGYGTMRAVVRF